MTRPRKPTAIKKMQGNPGQHKLPENEPQFDGLHPDPPKHLGPLARECWAGALHCCPVGMLGSMDWSALEAWCVAVERYREIDAAWCEDRRVLITTTKGEEKINPMLVSLRNQLQLVVKTASELGFSPTSRSKVQVPQHGTKANEFGEFVGTA